MNKSKTGTFKSIVTYFIRISKFPTLCTVRNKHHKMLRCICHFENGMAYGFQLTVITKDKRK